MRNRSAHLTSRLTQVPNIIIFISINDKTQSGIAPADETTLIRRGGLK